MAENRLQHDLLKELLHRLESAGVTPKELFHESGLPAVSTWDQAVASLTGYDALALLETAARLTADPCLAFRLGEAMDIKSYGSFGFALMSSANLRASTQLLLRYGGQQFAQRWEAHQQGENLLLRISFQTGTAARKRLGTELYLAHLMGVSRVLYRGQVEGVELQLDYPAPAHQHCYRDAFPVAIKFDSQYTQLCIPAQVLDTPVRSANASEHVVFHQRCEEMLRDDRRQVPETTAAVRRLVIQSIGELPHIAQIAESLYMSERTLRRRLDAETTQYRVIVDDIRNLLAREYLSDTPLPVAEIAHLLGYNETVNFRRAFARWNKVTPNQYRQQETR